MPSVKNPNGPSKNRLVARASKARSVARKRGEEARNKISKADTTRGARPGILPTSGPKAKLSAKKQRKLEKKMGYALKRRMEAEDAPANQDDVDKQIAAEEMEGIQ
ncbi:hypothetical protein RJ55_04590 [Drechmeria coniospora]|nr:hypothetical protein RJ55_04590 [Drechmeria coniospora]